MTGDRDTRDSGPVFTATKRGADIRLSRDPHPETKGYLVIEAPGLLVLLQNERGTPIPIAAFADPECPPSERDHDAQLRNSFEALRARVTPSIWSSSSTPQADLGRIQVASGSTLR